MLSKNILYPVSLVLSIAFLFGCSSERSDQNADGSSAKELKAKIVYFSIPG